MRCARFAVLSAWCLIAALVAVALGAGSAPAAVVAASDPSEPCLAETRDGTPTIDADHPLGADAATDSGSHPPVLAVSRLVATAAPERGPHPTRAAHPDRAPPLA